MSEAKVKQKIATMNNPNALYNLFRPIYSINFPLRLSISKGLRARPACSLEFERALVITVTEVHLQVTRIRFLACKVTRFASDLLCKYCGVQRSDGHRKDSVVYEFS